MPAHRALGAALLLLASTAAAQENAPFAPRFEGRAGLTLSGPARPFAGLGVSARAGWYVRVGAVVVAPIASWEGERAPLRGELAARFLFDPYGDRPRGLYAGAGIGVAHSADRTSEYLLILAGLEGRTAGRVVPAFEVTLGGGIRAAVVLRPRRDIGR